MNEQRQFYLRRNTITSVSYELLTVICGIILPRYFIEYFGSAANGLISSITHFLGLISLCELGMGAVVPANLYKPLAMKDEDAVSRIAASARRFYRNIAIIMIAYVAVLAWAYPIMAGSSFGFIFTASLVLIISASTFLQYFFGITYSLLLKADQKQYVSLFLNSVTMVLNTIISVVLIRAGLQVHVVKLVSAMIFIARPLVLLVYIRRHYQINWRIQYTGEPIKQKWNGVAQHLARTIQERADIVILTVFSTLENVSIYSVYFMIINGIKGLVYSFTAGVSALIGNMIANGEKAELERTFSRFEWLMHTTATLLFTVTAILVVPFVRLYTVGIEDANYIVPLFGAIMSMALAFRCIQMPYNVVVQAAGHFKETQRSAIIEPSINVIISIVFVLRYGLVGVAIGTLVSMSYRAVYLAMYLMHNILYNSSKKFVKQILIDFSSGAVMVVSTIWIKTSDLTLYNWIATAFIVCIICAIEAAAVNCIFYRAEFLGFVKMLLRIKKVRSLFSVK